MRPIYHFPSALLTFVKLLSLPYVVPTRFSTNPFPFTYSLLCYRVTFSSFYENKMDPWEACVFIYSFVYKHGAHWMLELNKICENFLSVEKRTGRVELLTVQFPDHNSDELWTLNQSHEQLQWHKEQTWKFGSGRQAV